MGIKYFAKLRGHLVIFFGYLLALMFFVLTCIVSYKSDYLKRIQYKIMCKLIPVTEQTDYWAVRGWYNCLKKSKLTADIVFFGNSITYGSNFGEYFATDGLNIINLGYPGDNIQGMFNRIDMITCVHPRKFFIMAGINGLKEQGLDEFREKYSTLIMAIKDSLPNSKLYLESILPVNSRMELGKKTADNKKIIEANKLIKSTAAQLNCTYVDLWSLYVKNGEMPKTLTKDGVHLKPDSYDRWGDAIHKYVLE